MTKQLLAAVLGLLVACGANSSTTKPDTGSGSATTTGECAPTDCGAEPPISPTVCPEGAAISTQCTRVESGACERQILCDGQELEESAPPVDPLGE
jgi:hypothetical protein